MSETIATNSTDKYPRDFCGHCGADVPPRNGEGTCEFCETAYRKPHKGRISVTGEFKAPGLGLGYGYFCKFLDHPVFGGRSGHTSYVIKDDRDIPRHLNDSYEIETRNSRYTVIPIALLSKGSAIPAVTCA